MSKPEAVEHRSLLSIRDIVAEERAVAGLLCDFDGDALTTWRDESVQLDDLTHPNLRRFATTYLEAVFNRGAAEIRDVSATVDQDKEQGVWKYLWEITRLGPGNITHYCRSIRLHAEQRKAAYAIDHALGEASSPAATPTDRAEALDRARAVKVPQVGAPAPVSRADLLNELFAEDVEGRTATPPVPTSLQILDDTMAGGWRAGRLYVLSALPGSGKTSLALGACLAAARAGNRVAFVSLEMSERELIKRMRSYISGVPLNENVRPTPSDEVAIRNAYAEISDLDWHIREGIPRSLDDISDWLCALHAERQLGLVVLDYLGRLPTPKADREDIGIGQNVGRCKTIAGLLKVPFLLLAQPNREVMQRSGHKFFMSDLRGSGQIEQDADWIGFLWQRQEGDPHPEGYAELDIVKHRHGPKRTIPLYWHGPTFRYQDPSSTELWRQEPRARTK